MPSDSQPKLPIFIIGSPRSGTSILTWCLGQHPNLLPLPESNWMAPFAVDAAVAYRRGSLRGALSQMGAMGIVRDEFVRELGDCIFDSIIRQRTKLEEHTAQARRGTGELYAAFAISRAASDPKSRWVNGTPEYSFGVAGLRKLFPAARFVHLVRDCDDVVASLMRFDSLAGQAPIINETEGYAYWSRYVRACLAAEEAYGSTVVCLILYRDLVAQPEQTIRRILDFVGESYAPACVEPLAVKINSSHSNSPLAPCNPPADAPTAKAARELWETLRAPAGQSRSSSTAPHRLEQEFEERVAYHYGVNDQLSQAQVALQTLNQALTERTAWALELGKEIARKDQYILNLQREFDERTAWALLLQTELEQTKVPSSKEPGSPPAG